MRRRGKNEFMRRTTRPGRKRFVDGLTRGVENELNTQEEIVSFLNGVLEYKSKSKELREEYSLSVKLNKSHGSSNLVKALNFIRDINPRYADYFREVLRLLLADAQDHEFDVQQVLWKMCSNRMEMLSCDNNTPAKNVELFGKVIQLLFRYAMYAGSDVPGELKLAVDRVRVAVDDLKESVRTPLQRELVDIMDHTVRQEMEAKDLADSFPGKGRHSQDLAHFNFISSTPAVDEVLYKIVTSDSNVDFLPKFDGTDLYLTDFPRKRLLDRLYRLVREDMMSSIVDKYKLVTNAMDVDSGRGMIEQLTDSGYKLRKAETSHKERFVPEFQNCKMVQWVGETTYRRGSHPCSGLKLRFALPRALAKMKKFDFKTSRLLKRDSLVYFTHNSQFLFFGIVQEEPELRKKTKKQAQNNIGEKKESAVYEVVVNIPSETDVKATLRLLAEGQNMGCLVDSQVSYFACKPILLSLKKMDLRTVPLSRVIANGEAPSLPDYYSAMHHNRAQSTLFSTLDEAQQHAMNVALKNDVALVQGQPGSGKTYIGALFARYILKYTNLRILCVCYTNHAIDQFMNDLLPYVNHSDVMRIGHGSKDDKIANLVMGKGPRNLEYNERHKRMGILRKRHENGSLLYELHEQLYKVKKEDRVISWRVAKLLFEHHSDQNLISQFQFQQALTDGDDTDGFQVASGKKKKITPKDVWRAWQQGKAHPNPHYKPENTLFDIEGKTARAILIEGLWDTYVTSIIDELTLVNTQQLKLREELNDLNSLRNVKEMKTKRMIFATTTGAAMYSAALSKAGVAQVVIVEEAAEIQEAHVLTSLSKDTQHLVLIGDHKQLRPKIDSYKLQQSSGNGYGLDVSLFERLALHCDNVEVPLLMTQHRMRPEIASVARAMKLYTESRDAKSTLGRADILGVQCNVAFINHTHTEEAASKSNATSVEELTSRSRMNKHEALMAVAIADYFLKQGYSPDKIVILCSYLGQLMLIRKLMASHKTMSAALGAVDQLDANKAEDLSLDQKDEGKQELPVTQATRDIRLATVDNYQGEESDIVIVSMVRCNERGDIGYLWEHQRINVLLTRARLGMFILGSRHTFENARKKPGQLLWGKIMAQLDAQNAVYDGFPAKCQKHPDHTQLLASATDFLTKVPDGGCQEPCLGRLTQCGHQCPRKCHVDADTHDKIKCRVLVDCRCVANLHAMQKECYWKIPHACQEKVEKKCARRIHDVFVLCCQAPYKSICEQCKADDAHKERLKEIAIAHAEEEKKMASERQQEREKRNLAKVRAEVEQKRKDALIRENEKDAAHAKMLEELAAVGERDVQEIEARGAAQRKAALLAAVSTSRNDVNQQFLSSSIDSQPHEGLKTAASSSLPPAQPILDPVPKPPHAADVHLNRVQKCLDVAFVHISACLRDEAPWHHVDISLDDAYLSEQLTAAIGQLQQSHFNEVNDSVFDRAEDGCAHATLYRAYCLLRRGDADFYDDVEADLQTYMQVIERGEGWDPLYLLAFALFLRHQEKVHEAATLFHLFTMVNGHAAWLEAGDSDLFELSEAIAQREEKKQLALPSHRLIDRWKHVKHEFNVKSEAMDNLLSMTGLSSVKMSIIDMCESSLRMRRLPEEKRITPSANFVFVGNAGTGKTTVARLLGSILFDIGVRKCQEFHPTDASKLRTMGGPKFQTLLDERPKDWYAPMVWDKGVVFIDEAYALNPSGDPSGKAIMEVLLLAAEDRRDQMTFILAGYKDDIESKLFAWNQGVKSRFQDTFEFPDYTVPELKEIWSNMLNAKGWTVDDPKVSDVAARRVGQAIGSSSFGNARDVRKLFERAVTKAASRDEDIHEIRITDVIGQVPTVENLPALRDALDDLNRLTGLQRVKDAINALVKTVQVNYGRELVFEKPLPLVLNRLFLGNPGTGKTTVATIWGRVLQAIGILSDGKVEVKTFTDLMGSHVGESQTKTSALINNCLGKVLVIDEAYGLDDNMYGKQAIDALISKVHGRPGEDIAVILIGYRDDMLKMLDNQNPGLKRRFAPANAIIFDDFSLKELEKILLAKCKSRKLKMSRSTRQRVMQEILGPMRNAQHFGNAGAVANVLDRAQQKAMNADNVTSPMQLMWDHFVDPEEQERKGNPLRALDGLYNMSGIREKIQALQVNIEFAKRDGDDAPTLPNFLFLGGPGTGKTTVAKVMGRILFSVGLLSCDKVVETNASELCGQFIGEAQALVKQKMNEATGGVLFIDEAYNLGKGQYGAQVMDTLIAQMTLDNHKGKTSVVLAGYTTEMKQMLDANPGMARRFTEDWSFPNWQAADCVAYVQTLCEKNRYAISDNAAIVLKQGFVQLAQSKNFGNASDVKNVYAKLVEARRIRITCQPKGDSGRDFTMEDAQAVMDAKCAAATPASTPSNARAKNDSAQVRMRTAERKQPLQRERQQENMHVEEGDEKEWEVVEAAPTAEQIAQYEEQLCEHRAKLDADEKHSRDELERLYEEKSAREEALQQAQQQQREDERRRIEKQLAELERLRVAEQARLARLAKEREKVKVREKLRRLGVCPASFQWREVHGGYRCTAGGHFVSLAQIDSITIS